jgi:hypothetical protein
MLGEHLHELLLNFVVQLLESVTNIDISHLREHHHEVISDLILYFLDLS